MPTDDGTAGRSTGHENTTKKTHPRQTAGERTRGCTPQTRPSIQFPAETPKRHAETTDDEIIVAGEDAVLLEPTGGDRE
ncbi:hypothetical protein D8S78_24645 [Natrialba swarupiae]|nr:hypothetical protein [Natrialba swarupiae]